MRTKRVPRWARIVRHRPGWATGTRRPTCRARVRTIRLGEPDVGALGLDDRVGARGGRGGGEGDEGGEEATHPTVSTAATAPSADRRNQVGGWSWRRQPNSNPVPAGVRDATGVTRVLFLAEASDRRLAARRRPAAPPVLDIDRLPPPRARPPGARPGAHRLTGRRRRPDQSWRATGWTSWSRLPATCARPSSRSRTSRRACARRWRRRAARARSPRR